MIFPTESVYHKRSVILDQVHAGKITDREGAVEALQADPHDANALFCLGHHAELEDQLDEAERYAREAVHTHPSSAEGYFLLARVISRRRPDSPLAGGYARLGSLKMQFDPEATDEWVEAGLEQPGEEPPEVEAELRPHRLVHQLRDHRDEVLDRSLVDEILEHKDHCEPLLLGILKECGEEQLTGEDFSVIERALVLLGEIGSLAAIPALTEFLTLPEEDLSGPADWAFRRILHQRPAETQAVIREMLPAAGTAERVVLAEQLSMMPEVPGRAETLSELLAATGSFPAHEREPVIFAAITGFYVTEGAKSPQAAALEREYAGSFSKEGRADLRKLHEEIRGLQPGEAPADELSVYDICCADPPEDEHHHHHHQEPVRVEPKPGRNEPCWCGSGKKYKKCHLDQDRQA